MNSYREEVIKTIKKIKYSELLEQRMTYEEIVKWQPQFKGQAPHVPYFWNKYMKGEYDDCSSYITFSINDLDLLLFPELKKRKRVKLMTAHGRVMEV